MVTRWHRGPKGGFAGRLKEKLMKILGFDYSFERFEMAHEDDSFGRYCVKSQKILIAEGLHPQQEISAIVHEVLEVLDYHLDLTLGHQAVMALDASLFQILSDAGVDLEPLRRELGSDHS